MPHRNSKASHRDSSTTHPGSLAADVKKIGGKGDFGVPESNVPERNYTSANTRRADRGAAPIHSGEDGSRTSGVGGNESGVGSSSGGDLDTDIIGVGTGEGLAASGKIEEPPGPDDATGTSRDFASGPPARGDAPPRRSLRAGSTVQEPDERTIGPQGADAASHPEAGDDAFAGEVSSDEASGRNDAGD